MLDSCGISAGYAETGDPQARDCRSQPDIASRLQREGSLWKLIKAIYYSRFTPRRFRHLLGTCYFLNCELGRPYYDSKVSPHHFRWSLGIQHALVFDYGHLASIEAMAPVDANGDPIPWYTYPAIDFLRQLDFSDKTVFEYGSGQSTIFWGNVAKSVVSVEHDPKWFETITSKVGPNCEVILRTDPEPYVSSIESYGGFDVIVVDGIVSHLSRFHGARHSVGHLNKGGLIILDNADYLPASANFLREMDLLEVDMSGPGPDSGHMWTTSMFFHRDFDFPSKTDRRPAPGIGAVDQNWEVEQKHHPSPWSGEEKGPREATSDAGVLFGSGSGSRRQDNHDRTTRQR